MLTNMTFAAEDDKVFVSNISYSGLETFKQRDFKDFIRTQEPAFFLKKEFDRRIVKLDAISIKSYYISKGFLETTVKDSVIINENKAEVYFIIKEGLRYYLRNIELTGNNSFSEKEILYFLKLEKGAPFNAISSNRNIANVEAEYFNKGRLLVDVKLQSFISDSVDINITIIEGPEVYIKKTFIEGLRGLDSTIVIREFEFNSGDRFDRRIIEKTQKKLLETGVFSFANITPVNVLGNDTLVNLVVELRQFKPREWKSAGGYYPIEYFDGSEPVPGLGGELGWSNRRVFKTSTNFSTHITSEFPIDYKILYPKLRFDIDFSNQWFIGFRIPTRLNFYYETFKNYGYEEQFPIHRLGIEEVNTFNFLEWSSMEFGLRVEKFIQPNQGLFNKDIEQRTAYYSLNLFRADQPLNPHQGYRLEGTVSQTGGALGGNYHFFKGDAGLSLYYNPFNEIVAAGRFKIGQIWGWSDDYDDVRYDKFYLGGSTSMRGWPTLRFEESKNTEGDLVPSGGLARLLMNFELRFPLFWIIGGEIFADGGIIADSFTSISTKSMRWDSGVGLTIMTPLGPARLDYAVQLEGERMANIELGFQYSF